MPEPIITPAVVDIKPGEETPKTPAEIEKEVEAAAVDKTPANMVPEAVFLEQKKNLKKAEQDIKDLRKLIEDGASPREISSDIDAIAEEYKVDKGFLKKFANTVRAETKKEVESDINSKQAAEVKAKDADDAFKKHYKIALDRMPEFTEIVNEDVIKALTKLPANANKTFSQIIEEAYGKSLTGKRTIEPTIPGGGKDPEPLDFDKARKDSTYFAEVMSNPALKKEYNTAMLKKGF